MSYVRHWAITKGLWTLALAPVVAIGLTGCGGEAPVTSADGGYQPAATDTGSGQAGSDTPDSPGTDVATGNDTPGGQAPPVQPPATPPMQPPAVASTELNKIPDGADEIESFLQGLLEPQLGGATQEERMQQFAGIQEVRIKAADKLMSANGATQEQLRMAIDTRLNALATLGQIDGSPANVQKIGDRIVQFISVLEKHQNKDVASIGKLLSFRHAANNLNAQMYQLKQSGGEAKLTDQQLQPVLKQLEDLLKTPDEEGNYLVAGREAAMIFQQVGRPDLAADALLKTGAAYKDAKDADLASTAYDMTLQAPFVRAEFQQKLQDTILNKEGAEAEVMKLIDKAAEIENPTAGILVMLSDAANYLEITDHHELALKIYNKTGALFKSSKNADLAEEAAGIVEKANTRLGLIGNPLIVEGSLPDGTPFDFTPYKGKVVLVDFWATWCRLCIEEMPNLLDAYNKWNGKGFEIIGVNVNNQSSTQEAAALKEFNSQVSLKWPTVISANKEEQGVSGHPMAVRCGVTKLPLVVLIGADGKVAALHLRGNNLHKKLEELLGPPLPPAPAGVTPDSTAGNGPTFAAPANSPAGQPVAAPEQPASQPQPPAPVKETAEQAADKKAEPKPAKPAATDGASAAHQQLMEQIFASESYFTHFEEEPSPADAAPAAPAESPASETPDDGKKDDSKIFEEFDKKKFNLYAPPASATTPELVEYLFKAGDKAPILRTREGFIAGVAEAMQRIIDAEPKPQQLRAAAVTTFTILHEQASLGDEEADKHLIVFANKLHGVEDKRIAAEVTLYQLEDLANKADSIEIAQIPEVLVKLRDYFDGQKLTEKHLRLASTTVGLINRLENQDDADEAAELEKLRESYFKLFGAMFAKSKFKRLAKYGKRISKDVVASSNQLVGKKLELTGATALGVEFNWEAYRGKVVVVDFWATWCGPCVRQTPLIKAAYEKYREQGFEVVGICCDDKPDALAPFIEKHKITWENIVTPDSQSMASKYGIRGFPTMLLIDQEGVVVDSGHDINRFLKKTEELLKAAKEADAGDKPAAKTEKAEE